LGDPLQLHELRFAERSPPSAAVEYHHRGAAGPRLVEIDWFTRLVRQADVGEPRANGRTDVCVVARTRGGHGVTLLAVCVRRARKTSPGRGGSGGWPTPRATAPTVTPPPAPPARVWRRAARVRGRAGCGTGRRRCPGESGFQRRSAVNCLTMQPFGGRGLRGDRWEGFLDHRLDLVLLRFAAGPWGERGGFHSAP